MASWGEIEEKAPDLAAKFIGGGIWFGSMPALRKGADIARDHRFALHSGSIGPPGWEGDAKLSGLAEEIVDVREVAVTRPTEAKDELAIDSWSEAGGVRSLTRR
jgi:hypothetical protein